MNSISRKEVLEKVKTQIMNVRGIVGVFELNKEQCDTISNLEEMAMKNFLFGMGQGKNEGVKESLSREVTLALFTDIQFNLPENASVMELISVGEVVGMTTTNLNIIKEFKRDKRYIVISDFFVIKRDAKINSATFASGKTYFLFRGVQLDQFSKISGIKNHILSFPSPLVFNFLKNEFKDRMNLSDPKLACLLLGFDLG